MSAIAITTVLMADRIAFAVPLSETKIVASDALPDDFFGSSVDLEDEMAIGGSFGDDRGQHVNAGSAYIYENITGSGWIETAKLLPDDPHSLAFFGSSVAVSGAIAAIGAHGVEVDRIDFNSPSSHGAAYIFKKTSQGAWEQTAQLLSTERSYGDQFGSTIDVDGQWAIVGSPRSGILPGDLDNSGAAFVYDVNQTGRVFEVAKLLPGDDDPHVWFGSSVAISGHVAIVGEYGHDANGMLDVGAAYIFERGNDGLWSQVARLASDVLTAQERFGWDVAIDGDRALVIARSGTFIFGPDPQGEWVQKAKIIYDIDGPLMLDGAISNNIVAVADPSADEFRGEVRLFQAASTGEWSEIAQFTGSDVMEGDEFGRSVAIDGPHVMAGAPRSGLTLLDAGGSAYVFEIPEPTTAGLLLVAASLVYVVSRRPLQ